MKWTGTNDLRESYLKFFESKGHTVLKSAPLIPHDDNSILLINAGMTPLKKYFQGTATPPSKRVASCQKCIRTPDIENVGITPRHGTYFEMLGNFSFGDYFKKEIIPWAWEYLTEVLEIPEDKLFITVYEEDDEAYDIWVNDVKIPESRMTRLGKKDNFWEHGSGPCGPCSEIHFDSGIENGCGDKDCMPGCDCNRYVEIWNLVFTQFDSDGKGNYTPLQNKNIDTGLGLDRLAYIMQGVNNMFEIDTTKKIMDKACSIIGKKYKENDRDDISIRIITDHVRSGVFMIGDGIRPSNEGRGYVLRRILRRAARHGRLVGYNEPFLYKIIDTVIDENKSAYPELDEKREYIKKVMQSEEESFGKTIENGMNKLGTLTSNMKKGDVLSGDEVFKLHDTYGFPLDLTREILAESGFSLDEERFRELMKIQKDTARQNQAFKNGWGGDDLFSDYETEFVGYETLQCKTTLEVIMVDGEKKESCSENENVAVLITKTPFYAESGGQVGDKGMIETTNGDNRIVITDTKKVTGGQIVSYGYVEKGSFSEIDSVLVTVDYVKRHATMRNHTAAHLLQAALRHVLGDHVHQAGSYVDSEKCRFDFSHFQGVTADEIANVEEIVNDYIMSAIKVTMTEMPIEKAQEMGAMALFGEKYGDTVRVVEAKDCSIEFCGGTHVDNTSKIGLFKIISESSVAAGVRRIEAVTGKGVLKELQKANDIIHGAAKALKLANPLNLIDRTETVMQEISVKNQEISKLQKMISSAKMGENIKTERINDITVITAALSGVVGDGLRSAADEITAEGENFVIILAGYEGEKGNLLCKCSKGAISKGLSAGNLVKNLSAIAGGKGGGKPDTAMAGINDISKIDELFAAVPNLINEVK